MSFCIRRYAVYFTYFLPFPIHIKTIPTAERLVLSCICPTTPSCRPKARLQFVSSRTTLAVHAAEVLIPFQAVTLILLAQPTGLHGMGTMMWDLMVWIRGTVRWTVSAHLVSRVSQVMEKCKDSDSPRNAPALLTSRPALLEIRELPEMVDLVQRTNLHEPCEINVSNHAVRDAFQKCTHKLQHPP